MLVESQTLTFGRTDGDADENEQKEKEQLMAINSKTNVVAPKKVRVFKALHIKNEGISIFRFKDIGNREGFQFKM